eukprot:TRINITY_DN13296_c0_g1_i1.p1 TRINITY_DN13296_c0_g1~~TRINITY_DN13296_c0_g1_i1.p1  ORF type:complete len:455 (-),score=66.03 TRINITY_DN13296_c0_g1_i1:189-1553(-)
MSFLILILVSVALSYVGAAPAVDGFNIALADSTSNLNTLADNVTENATVPAVSVTFVINADGATKATIDLPLFFIECSQTPCSLSVSMTDSFFGSQTAATYFQEQEELIKAATIKALADLKASRAAARAAAAAAAAAASDGRRLSGTCIVTGANVINNGNQLELLLSDGSGGSCAKGSRVNVALTPTVSATFLTQPLGRTLTFTVTTDATGASAVIRTITISDSGVSVIFAVSDPITIYKGKKTKFWLPLHTLMPLVKTPDVTVMASVFPGPLIDQQWFDRFVILTTRGEQVAEVRLAPQVTNQSGQPRRCRVPGTLCQLEIFLSNSNAPTATANKHLFDIFGVKVGVGRQQVSQKVHGHPVIEFLVVETDSITFIISAAHAGNEFPHDAQMQKKYTHLDWITLDIKDEIAWTGVLPELWGIAPLSDEVAAMKVAPTASSSTCADSRLHGASTA